MKTGKYAYVGRVLCWIKNNANNRGYRNNWCENDGDCATCSYPQLYENGSIKLSDITHPPLRAPEAALG